MFKSTTYILLIKFLHNNLGCAYIDLVLCTRSFILIHEKLYWS